MKRIASWDIAACMLIVLAVAAICLPVLGVGARSHSEARCQSNLHRLGEALAAYAADNGCFPTNRRYKAGTTEPMPTRFWDVTLSPLTYDAHGDPTRFAKGIAWVDHYPYVIDAAKKRDQDWLSVFVCPNATNGSFPTNSPTARVSYVLNINLLDVQPQTVRRPEFVFMVREMDRKANSICRPMAICTGDPAKVPYCPFLTSDDPYLSRPISWLHARGSYVLFADGHARYFTTDYFPKQSYYGTARCWDSQTGQWWNYGPGSGVGLPLLKSIAITP